MLLAGDNGVVIQQHPCVNAQALLLAAIGEGAHQDVTTFLRSEDREPSYTLEVMKCAASVSIIR